MNEPTDTGLPEDELARFFYLYAPTSLARLLLSVWPDDADEVLRLIEHADLASDAKRALFCVLARLTSRLTPGINAQRAPTRALLAPD